MDEWDQAPQEKNSVKAYMQKIACVMSVCAVELPQDVLSHACWKIVLHEDDLKEKRKNMMCLLGHKQEYTQSLWFNDKT